MRTLAAASVLSLLTLLTACGGGGSGDSGETPPSVSAGVDQTVDEGTQVALTGSASGNGGATIATLRWEQVSGPAVSISRATSNPASFTAPATKSNVSLLFRLTATDSHGESASDETAVSVNPVNAAPTVSAGADQSVNAREVVTLSGSASDVDGEIASLAWSQVSGTGVTIAGADTLTPTFSAPIVAEVESATFRLTGRDDEGGSSSDEVTVTINPTPNQAPVANAGGDLDVVSDTSVDLDGSGVDNDGAIASYQWTQTGGPTVGLNGADSASVSFTAPILTATQPVTLRLTVTDNEGATGSDEITITVHPIGADGSDWDSMVWGEGSWG